MIKITFVTNHSVFFRLCAGGIDVFIDVFLGIEATMEEVIQAAIASKQYIITQYHILNWASFGVTCSHERRL